MAARGGHGRLRNHRDGGGLLLHNNRYWGVDGATGLQLGTAAGCQPMSDVGLETRVEALENCTGIGAGVHFGLQV